MSAVLWERQVDERDAIQKKTFTKWVNKHLIKANKRVDDLFVDLQDGHGLLSLLEVLSGETLPREKGRMRFHMLQNVQTALNFLRYRKVKLVNIRAEDIVDGNPKLTLGLIWTIILHFQVRRRPRALCFSCGRSGSITCCCGRPTASSLHRKASQRCGGARVGSGLLQYGGCSRFVQLPSRFSLYTRAEKRESCVKLKIGI
ncbi:hypothetical protein HPB48_006416 [Haemaphysalis longicornis]|uniref:Calponin-homology (CH) domain-containing protein n=1 Tax=Haemaphysalis longicornis TaxID=44386 RepID=A0A9J6FAI5_HAELO|nr:hypothetical protein HPB48_006416 [Haemaphysalis longicornis]